MTISSGTRLGAYEILSPIGAGGMGEVYRARDTRLGRDVAIKVLPETVARDAERLARFEREARALAALNHPGIVTIFSVEESGDTRYLAMELVEGESLDTIVASGDISLERFFAIATPLAEALSAAHERGIVHRDLKPGNVMVTREGRVKVLDFGLARVEASGSDPNLTSTPTQSRADLTGEGQVFGTVAYMSPEQARGGKVDARSDVFSLGVVLYQMLTGERPFQGASAVDLISSILRDRPPSVTDLRADVPPHLSRILRRCLEKDPRDRYQTSRDVYNELKELKAETSSPSASARHPSSPVPVTEESLSVAVLPFQHRGASPEVADLAEGMTDEIVTGLSRFSYLRVISRSSTRRFAGEAADARAVGRELDARYVLDGSLRQSGAKLRVAVQLVDASSGAQLWSQTYDQEFRPDAVFEVQDALVPRIVSTVADMHGALPRSMSDALRHRAPDTLSPREAVLRSFGYFERVTPEELSLSRSALELAVRREPNFSDAWAMLALLSVQDYTQGFRLQPDSLETGTQAARRAVDLAPTSPLAHFALAQALFFRKEFEKFRVEAERTLALNPMDGNSLAFLAEMLAYSGEWDRALTLADRARQLNPHHPGWYWHVHFNDAYRRRDYRGAMAFAVKMDTGNWGANALAAAASAQLGDRESAGRALKELLRQRPTVGRTIHEDVEKWFDAEHARHIIDGLRKAGLEIAGETRASEPPSDATSSGETRTAEGFWVAVLPFKHSGADDGLATFAEGMTDEIMTGLSRFPYLRVLSRGSTSPSSSEAPDARAAGRALGARYVMEGSVRQMAGRLRVAVQLVDAVTGVHLWAENFERSFTPESLFELQDDLVSRIVSTVADMAGVLPRSMSESLRSRPPDQLSPYEAVLRSFAYFDYFTPEELAAARSGLEAAVRKAPTYADAWAMLSILCAQDYVHGYDLQPNALDGAASAARRAVELGPSNPLSYFSLAQSLSYQKDFDSFRFAAERAVELNPMDGLSVSLLGELLTYAGSAERGMELAGRAKRLNPNHPGGYWYADFYEAFSRGDYRGALDFALKVKLRGNPLAPMFIAAAAGHLGDVDQGSKAVRDLLKFRPELPALMRKQVAKVWNPEYGERFLEGLRKAGLDIPEPGQSSPAAKPAAAVSIAVLPFADMSAAKDQEYLCEGMAEEIMNALVRVGGIRVASRTSAFRARQQAADLPAIAKALNVGHVLEGSVRTSGSQLRVTAQLTEVASGYQLWSERFDREAADVFAVQDEIAAGVVDAVKARLAPGAHTIAARPQARNLEAYRSYLKGRHLRGIEDHAGALRAFEEAVRLDPSHGPSWTGLAEITVLSAHFSILPARAACAAAREALATAEKLQGESAEGRHVEAFAAYIERRWDAMDAAWRRALELEPRHVLALGSYGITLCARGKPEEGLALFERAREADPLASFPYTLTAWGLLLLGRPEEALRYAEDALGFEKDDASAVIAASMANVALGRFEEGIAAAERGVAISHRGPAFVGGLGWALALAGRRDEARALLAELRARPANSPTTVSEVWLLGALGEIDEAFAVVARAEGECQGQLYYTGLPAFDPLRSDPRFAALLRRLERSPA